MAMKVPKGRHPNRLFFKGVLTRVDEASDRPPTGTLGKRVMLTRAAAEKALPTLMGMAIDYAPALNAHDAQRKIGVITSADIQGQDVVVSGFLYCAGFSRGGAGVEGYGRAGHVV